MHAMADKPIIEKSAYADTNTDSVQTDLQVDLIGAQRSHAIIDVHPAGDRQVYQSTIVGVDLDARCIEIDELFPVGFSGRRGQPLAVTLRLPNNRRERFATRLLDVGTDSGAPRYRLALPTGFTYEQKRQTYRFRLGARLGGYAEFRTTEHFLCSGSMQDISVRGLRVKLQQQVALAPGTVLDSLNLEFSGLRLQCQGMVRSCGTDIGGDAVVGIELLNLPRPQERSLERCLAQLHRQLARESAEARLAT